MSNFTNKNYPTRSNQENNHHDRKLLQAMIDVEEENSAGKSIYEVAIYRDRCVVQKRNRGKNMNGGALVMKPIMQKNSDMHSPLTVSDEELDLSEICIPIERFTVPRTVEDFRVLLLQIDKTVSGSTLHSIARNTISFAGWCQQMEAREKSLSCAPSEQLLDGNTRYNASAVIRAIVEHEEYRSAASAPVLTTAREETRIPLRNWLQRMTSTATLQ